MVTVRQVLQVFSEAFPHPYAVQFDHLAQLQRGAPEQAMLRVQRVMGGGVLNPLVEHVGDLIHRMTEIITIDTGGYEFVKPKVDRCLKYLTSGYGFEREFEENLHATATMRGLSIEAVRSQVSAALRAYAQAHAALPGYNRLQRLARGAAVAVGHMQWQAAVLALEDLQAMVQQGQAAWVRAAHEYDPDGRY